MSHKMVSFQELKPSERFQGCPEISAQTLAPCNCRAGLGVPGKVFLRDWSVLGPGRPLLIRGSPQGQAVLRRSQQVAPRTPAASANRFWVQVPELPFIKERKLAPRLLLVACGGGLRALAPLLSQPSPGLGRKDLETHHLPPGSGYWRQPF